MIGGYNPISNNSGNDLHIYIPGADAFLGPGLNGIAAVTGVISSTSFTYITNETQYTVNASASATVTPVKAHVTASPGPYVYDVKGGFAVTGTVASLTKALAQGQQYSTLTVDNASIFPDASGWLVLDFGYAGAVGPVKYLGRLSSTSLSIDYSFTWPQSVGAGATVTLLLNKGPFIPPNPEVSGSFYVTASPAGRVAAETANAASVAAGVKVNATITYPGDRGLGGEGLPVSGSYKISDKVGVWAGDDEDAEVEAARTS